MYILNECALICICVSLTDFQLSCKNYFGQSFCLCSSKCIIYLWLARGVLVVTTYMYSSFMDHYYYVIGTYSVIC